MRVAGPARSVLDVVAFVLGILFAASMVQSAFTMHTWPFRILDAAIAGTWVFALVRMASRAVRR